MLDLLGLLHEARDPDELAVTLMSQLRSIVACDLISYNDMDLTGAGTTSTYFEPELVPRPALEVAFEALLHEHPLVNDYASTGDTRVRRMSDFISLSDLQGLDLWREVFNPLETNHQLGLAVTLSPTRMAGIGLNRKDRDFTDRDMAVASLVQQHLLGAYDHARLRAEDAARSPSEMDVLTNREREVLALLATGSSNRDIARQLFITPATVAKHVENLRAKLGVRNRTEAAAKFFGTT